MPHTITVIDLTASHGLYALSQLGVPHSGGHGAWTDIALADSAHAPRIDWHRPQRTLEDAHIRTDAAAVVLLVGPGAASVLQKALQHPLVLQAPRLWVFMTPNAIVEEMALQSVLATLPAPQVYTLPNSDAQTLWFILMEQMDKLNFLAPAPEDSLKERKNMASNLKESMTTALGIDGAMAAALVDYRSGMCLAQIGTGLNLDLAAAGNTQVVQTKLKTMEAMGLRDKIEDILITLGDQYHLIRLAPNHPGLFLYLVLDKAKGNLALARYKLTDIERSLVV